MTIAPGAIVWATVPDKNGFTKDRPLVVVSIGSESDPTLVCACVTTRDANPRPLSYVRIPWDSHGRSASGLREQCFAVATWLVVVHVSDVRRQSGQLTSGPLAALLAKVGVLS